MNELRKLRILFGLAKKEWGPKDPTAQKLETKWLSEQLASFSPRLQSSLFLCAGNKIVEDEGNDSSNRHSGFPDSGDDIAQPLRPSPGLTHREFVEVLG